MRNFLLHFYPSWEKPIVKNIVDVIFWTFVLFSAYLLLLAQKNFWGYPRFQGVISFVSALCIALPLLVYRATRLIQRYRLSFVYLSEFLVAIPLGLNGLGALYFFDNGSWGYDSFAHFSSSLMGVVLIFLVVGGCTITNTVFTRTLFFFIAVAGAFLVGVAMEFWEWFADLSFATRTWGEVGQNPLYDTASDIFYDAVGVAFGALIIFFWGKVLLARLRRITPRVHSLARAMRSQMEHTVRQKIVEGKKRLQAIQIKHS